MRFAGRTISSKPCSASGCSTSTLRVVRCLPSSRGPSRGKCMRRNIFDEIHDDFRASAREFFERECVPNTEKWERDGKVSREAWLAAGAAGLIGWEFDEKYGGLGVKDFRFNQIISEEMFLTGSVGIGLGVQNDILMPYMNNLTTEEQKERWLPKFVSGEYIGSIAMSEPAAGSDLAGIKTTARDEGDHWVVNGQKTFISNGLLSKLVLTAVKTDPSARHKGISLLMIEDGMEGFTRGRKLDKIGQYSADTAELFFEDVKVPKQNLVGELNRGFYHLVSNLPSERVGVAWLCVTRRTAGSGPDQGLCARAHRVRTAHRQIPGQ